MAEERTAHELEPAEIRRLVDRLDDRMTRLEGAVAEATGAPEPRVPAEHFRELVDHARKEWGLLSRTAVDALRSADIAARERIAAEQAAGHVDQIGRQLEVELDTIASELHAHDCDDGSAADAWRAVGESWRGRVDELRVQANLARRELQDQAHHNVDRVEAAVEELRSDIEGARDRAAEASPEPGEALRGLIAAARSAARETGRWLLDPAGARQDDDGASQ